MRALNHGGSDDRGGWSATLGVGDPPWQQALKRKEEEAVAAEAAAVAAAEAAAVAAAAAETAAEAAAAEAAAEAAVVAAAVAAAARAAWHRALLLTRAQKKAVEKVNRVVADIEEELLKVSASTRHSHSVYLSSDSHLQLRMKSFTLRS